MARASTDFICESSIFIALPKTADEMDPTLEEFRTPLKTIL